MKKHLEQNSGYTLVEIIVYAALLVVLLGAIVNSMVLLTSSYKSIKAGRNTENAALSAMDQMTRDIRSSSSVNGASTVYNGAQLTANTLIPVSTATNAGIDYNTYPTTRTFAAGVNIGF